MAAIAVGILLFIVTLLYIDLEDTLDSARRLGLALPVILLPGACWQFLRTWGWSVAFPDDSRPAFTRLFRVRLAADAISFFTVRGIAGEPLKVLTWREVDEEITGVQAYQNAILKIVLGIVFLIVALGILNTVFMSLFERVREFGILKAMGARPSFVLRLVLVESCLLGGLGGGAGVLIGSALIAYYRQEGLPLPIGEAMSQFLPFDTVLHLRFDWPTHQTAMAAVVITSLLAALPPALRAARLKPVDCLRHR